MHGGGHRGTPCGGVGDWDEVAEFVKRGQDQRTDLALVLRDRGRPRRVQTAEGELGLAVPQLCNTAEWFVSQVLPDSGPP